MLWRLFVGIMVFAAGCKLVMGLWFCRQGVMVILFGGDDEVVFGGDVLLGIMVFAIGGQDRDGVIVQLTRENWYYYLGK